MSDELIFALFRRKKREWTKQPIAGLTQAEVDELNAVLQAMRGPPSPTALSDGAAFFNSVRTAFGPLKQLQVEGFETLLQAFGVARWPISWAAYGLTTAWHETNATMQPVREAYWLTEEWRKKNLRYHPWYGRGYVQLTWEANYKRADEEIGLAGALVADPDTALQPQVAAEIMVKGMERGWFCSKRLADYLPASGKAGADAFKQARRIINGTDKAAEIAVHAIRFQTALEAGGWR